jgi:omega-6 fatty acid desaturase (delta-12 desaturase)
VVPAQRTVFWADFILVAGFLLAFLAMLAFAGERWFDGAGSAILWGFLLPFAVWNAAMGFTVYAQHTHPKVAWFRDQRQWESLASQHRSTPYIEFPRWYGLISHDIMEHTAHHVAPKIPLYNLRLAQQRLLELIGNDVVQERFSLTGFLATMASCKLYDYENHFWLDFAGRPTTDCTLAAAAPTVSDDTTTAVQTA